MNATDILKRLRDEAGDLPEVIAPIFSKKEIVRVFINNHPYRLYVEVKTPGWYVIKPMSQSTAKSVREAVPFEIQTCLRAVPELRTIAMRRISESRWFVFPFNVSDAQSKNVPVQPLEVFLIDRNLEPFSVISARLWGKVLLFDSYLSPPIDKFSESLEHGDTEPPKISGTIPEFKTVYSMLTDELEQAKRRTVEGKIQGAIEYLGAELVGFKEFGDGYEVTYRDNGRNYQVRVSNSFRLRSAGICLSGLENQQTLASSVAVMRRSRQQDQYFYNNNEDDDEYSE